jgi:uncharacterized membrane protein
MYTRNAIWNAWLERNKEKAMVHAGGFYAMHGLGFGLGFLNLIGTILFFAFIFMVIKFFIKGGRYAAYRNWSGHEGHGRSEWSRGDWGRGGWNRGAPWMQGKEGQGKEGFRPEADDEAMSVARERLAQGEINPEQFETIKGGLKVDMSDAPMGRHDKAVHLARLRFAKGEITVEEFAAVKKTLLS